MSVAASAAALQSPGIHRSPDAFDAIPASVQCRKDIAHNAKRLLGLLRSVQNMNAFPSYADLATALGASVRSIVRWMAQLVGAGLITLWRRGQGLVNVATVVGMAIRSAIESRQRVPVRRADTRMEPRIEERRMKKGYIVPSSYAEGRLGTVPAR